MKRSAYSADRIRLKTRIKQMMKKLKHIIALLLEDAKRLQQLEPNAGTEARIWIAMKSLKCESSDYSKTTIKLLNFRENY